MAHARLRRHVAARKPGHHAQRWGDLHRHDSGRTQAPRLQAHATLPRIIAIGPAVQEGGRPIHVRGRLTTPRGLPRSTDPELHWGPKDTHTTKQTKKAACSFACTTYHVCCIVLCTGIEQQVYMSPVVVACCHKRWGFVQRECSCMHVGAVADEDMGDAARGISVCRRKVQGGVPTLLTHRQGRQTQHTTHTTGDASTRTSMHSCTRRQLHHPFRSYTASHAPRWYARTHARTQVRRSVEAPCRISVSTTVRCPNRAATCSG